MTAASGASRVRITGLELTSMPGNTGKLPAVAMCTINCDTTKSKFESHTASDSGVLWRDVDISFDLPNRDALQREVSFSVVGWKLRIAPFSSAIGECAAPLAAFATSYGVSSKKSFELFRDGKPASFALHVKFETIGIAAFEWTLSLFESDLRALRKAKNSSSDSKLSAGAPLVLDLPPSAMPFAAAIETLRALPNNQSAADTILSAPVLASLAHITQITAVPIILVSGGDAAAAAATEAADEPDDKSTPATAVPPAAVTPAASSASVTELERAIADATAAKRKNKYVGISYLDSQAANATSAQTTVEHVAPVAVGTAAAQQRRNEMESSRAIKQAQRLVSVGTTTSDDSSPLRYEPHAHLQLAWSAMALDGGDTVRRALVRSGVFTHLATFLNDAKSSRQSRELAMTCARHFFKFPRWQELMIADGLLSAFAHVLATEHDNEQAQLKCLELLACFDMRHQSTLIDCGVVQAVVQGIRGASWQLKMRSLAFVCHFDAQYQSRLVDCGLLPLLIAGAAVGERDAMRCAQCLNLMSRMPGQSAALLEHGVLPLVVDLLKSSSTRILSAALAVLASVASLATARRLADAGALVAVASIVRGRRDDTDLPWRTPAVLRAALVTLSSVLHSTGTDVAVTMIGSGAVLFDDDTHDHDDDNDDHDDDGKRGKSKKTKVSTARGVSGRIGVAENDEFESYDSEDDAAKVDAELDRRRRVLRRANCDALTDSGCIDALGAAALDTTVQDAVLSLLRDVDGAALVRSDVVPRFVAAINGEILPLPKRACDIAPPLSSTPVLDHEKRTWPTTVTVVEAEPLWHFLLSQAPAGALLGAGFLKGVMSFVHRSVRTKSRALLDAVFAHFPLRVLVEQRLPHHLFLIVARRSSDVAEAVPKASQRSAGDSYIEELAALENQYRRHESVVPGVQAAIEADIRAIDRYGGPHTDDFCRVLLSYVARLDDSDLTEPQYGWGGPWNKSPPELMKGSRASIIDLAIGMLPTHTQVVNELVAIFLKLSSETVARHGVVVRLLAIARNTQVPVTVVSRCLELLGLMSSTYLLERDVFDVLFGVVVSRHASLMPANSLARFDSVLTPTANDPQFAAFTASSAPYYSDIVTAALLMRRRLLVLLAFGRWRARLTSAGTNTAAQTIDNFPTYESWPGSASQTQGAVGMPRNALAITTVPSKDASMNWVRVLYSGEPGAHVRFPIKSPELCACRSGKLARDCCDAPAAGAELPALLGQLQAGDDVLVSSVDETVPAALHANESELVRVVDRDGGAHVINRTAVLSRWACELSHVSVLTWDVLRHCATHVTAISQNYAVACEAPPLPGGSTMSTVELADFIARTIVPIFTELAQVARDFVDSFDYSKMLRIAFPSQVGTFSPNEYASSAAMETVRQLWNNFHSVLRHSHASQSQYIRHLFLQLCGMTISLLKAVRCVVAQIVPSHDDELTSTALRLVQSKFSASELEQHDALGKLFKHWRTALTMRYPMQQQLLNFVVKQPSEVVWRSSFITLVYDVLRTNSSGGGYRWSLLTALIALLRTNTDRAERLLLGKTDGLIGSLPAQREHLHALVVSGIANLAWSSQSNLDMPFFFELTQLVSLKNQRAFWLQSPANHHLTWPRSEAPQALLHLLVDHLLCRAAVSSAVDPLMRVAAWVASLAPLLEREIVLHVFTTVLAIGVVGSGQATLHNTASTIEWMANRYVQSISPKAAPYLVPGTNRQRSFMSFPTVVQPGGALWFDTAPFWLTHVFIEGSARSSHVDVIAVYQLLHEVPNAEPPSEAELDAMSERQRGSHQRVRWSTTGDALPTAVTHTNRSSLVPELRLAHLPNGGWSACVYPPADALLPRASGMTEFSPLLPTPQHACAFAQHAGLLEHTLPYTATAGAAAALVPVRDVRWYFEDNDGVMQPCDVVSSHTLETAHRLQNKTTNYQHSGANYSVNFSTMQQTNQSTNRKRKMLRASWFEASDQSSHDSQLRPMERATADALEAAFITKRFEQPLTIGRESFMVFRDGTGFRATSGVAVQATGGEAVYRGFTERAMPTRFGSAASKAAPPSVATPPPPSLECPQGHLLVADHGSHAVRQCVCCPRSYTDDGMCCFACAYNVCPTCIAADALPPKAPAAEGVGSGGGSSRRRRKKKHDGAGDADDADDDDADADDKSSSSKSKRKAKKAAEATAPAPSSAPLPVPSRVRLTLIGFVRVPADKSTGELVFDPPVFCHNVVLQVVSDRAMGFKHARVFGVAANVTGEPPLKPGEVPLHQSVPLLPNNRDTSDDSDEDEMPGVDFSAQAAPLMPGNDTSNWMPMSLIRQQCRLASDPLHVCNRKCAANAVIPEAVKQPSMRAFRPRNGLPVSHIVLPHWACPCGSGEVFRDCCQHGTFSQAPTALGAVSPTKSSNGAVERCVCLSKLPYDQCCGRVAHLHAIVPSTPSSSSATTAASTKSATTATARKEQPLEAWNRWRSVLDYYASTNRPLTGVFARLPLATSFAPVLALGILRAFVRVDPEPLLLTDLPTARVAPAAAQSELKRLAKLASDGDESAFVRAVAGRAAYPLRLRDGHTDANGHLIASDAPAALVVDVGAPCWVLHAPLTERACAGWVFVWPRAVAAADESGKSVKKSRSKHRSKKSRKAASEKEAAVVVGNDDTNANDADDADDDDDDDGGAGDGKMKKETSAPVAAAAHESKVPRGDEIVVVPVTFVKDVLLLSDSEFKAAFNTVQKLQGRAVVDEAIAAVVAADAATKPTTQAPTPPQALPKGWRQYSTKDGSRTYYHNSVTHVTQWTRPVADEATSAASTSSQTSRATLLSQIAAGTTLKHVKTRMSGGVGMVRDSRSSSMSSDSSSLASSRPLAQSAAALGYVLSNMLGGVPPPPPPLPGAGDADEELFNRVVALYDYSGADQHELSFAQGDVITVLEENASGWWLGLILERKGYFPSNYCEPIAKKARTLFDIANEVPVTDVRAFRAAYKYVAMEPGEVSFSPGDDVTVEQKNGDWWVGTVNGVTGRFPAIMVEPAPVSVGAPGESLDALLDELGDLTQSIVAADLSDNIAAAASSSTTATNTRRQRLSIGQMPDYLVAPAPPRLVRSLSLDLVRRPTAAAALPSGAIAVPPPMPVGIIRPRRIITESEAQKHATSRVVQQHGDGLPLSEPVERPTAALPAPPPMAAPGEVVVPLDAETQRKYDQDAAVRLWFCQQALPPSGVGAFSGFVDVGVHDARVEHCLVSTNWLLLFLAARKCNYMSSCAVPRGANGNSIACPHGQLVVHSLMELALSKARRPAVVPSIAPTYDKTITSISSDTFFGSGNNNTSSSSSSSSIKRNKAPEDVGSRAASSSATTTKSATEQSGIDLVAVRERTRVMPKPCADLLGLHWSALTRVPLLRAEVRADGEIDDASLLASLRPCVECQQSGERRLADRDAYDRLFSASATSYAIVEGGWYQAWFKYIMDELGVEPAPPHGILNRSLFQVNTTRPRTNLVQARDYAPITRELWHYIASHYDADCMIATKYSSIYSSGLTVEAIEPKR